MFFESLVGRVKLFSFMIMFNLSENMWEAPGNHYNSHLQVQVRFISNVFLQFHFFILAVVEKVK